MKRYTQEFPIIGVNTFLSSKGSPTIPAGDSSNWERKIVPNHNVGELA
jgi:hypothetical protein